MIERLHAIFRDDVRNGLDEYHEAVTELVIAPLCGDVRRAADELARMAEIWEPSPPATLDEALARAASSRKRLRIEILGLMADRVESTGPVRALTVATASMLHAFEDAAGRYDSLVDVVEPETLYATNGDDSAVVRARKAWVRIQRSIRDRKRMEPYEITLRPRAHGAHLAAVVAPKLLVPQARSMLEGAGYLMGVVERDITRAFHEVLEAERLATHVSQVFPRSFPPPDESVRSRETNEVMEASLASATERYAELEEPWGEAHKALSDASAALCALVESLEQLPAREDLDVAGHALTDAFLYRLERDGTFMAQDVTTNTSASASEAWCSFEERSGFIRQWTERSIVRLRFAGMVSDTVDSLITARDRTISRLFEEIVEPFMRAHHDVSDRVRSRHPDVERALSEDNAADILTRIAQEAVADVDAALLTGFARDEVVALASSLPAGEVDTLVSSTASLPAIILNPLLDESAGKLPSQVTTKEVDVAEVIGETLGDAMRELLQSPVASFIARLDDIRAQDREISTSILFNIESAIEANDDAADDAREMATKGLSRSADALLTQARRAWPSFYQTVSHVEKAYTGTWARVHDRTRIERQVDEMLLDLRARFDTGTQSAVSTLGRRARYARLMAGRYSLRARRHGKRLIQAGREALGGNTVSAEQRHETIEALLTIDEALDKVPVIYRKLFSFAPVQEVDMLVGRRRDVEAVADHRSRWLRGFTQSLVLTSKPSSGATSLLNVLYQSVFKSDTVTWIELSRRITSEEDLISLLHRELDIPAPASTSLRDLSTRILAAGSTRRNEAAQAIPVVVIEHLELLMLRRIGGMRLISEMLSFMSRTDSRILWVASCSEFAWQLISKSESTSAGLVSRVALSSIDRDGLEKLVMGRHSRSGLGVHFLEPADPATILRRRLRQARSDQERQGILREQYFDRLHIQVGANILMALFYWIRSVRRTDDEDTLSIVPFDPISFRFLSDLPLDHALMLKALLEHFTLTVADAASVLHASPDACMHLFESLGNALIIEPYSEEGQANSRAFSTVDESRPYRIRPLLVHPVVQFLRGLNIIH